LVTSARTTDLQAQCLHSFGLEISGLFYPRYGHCSCGPRHTPSTQLSLPFTVTHLPPQRHVLPNGQHSGVPPPPPPSGQLAWQNRFFTQQPNSHAAIAAGLKVSRHKPAQRPYCCQHESMHDVCAATIGEAVPTPETPFDPRYDCPVLYSDASAANPGIFIFVSCRSKWSGSAVVVRRQLGDEERKHHGHVDAHLLLAHHVGVAIGPASADRRSAIRIARWLSKSHNSAVRQPATPSDSYCARVIG
jgi:hypothetical protein